MNVQNLQSPSNNEINISTPPLLKTVRYLPFLVLAVCLLITWHLYQSSQSQVENELQEYFNFRVRQAVNLTEQRILAQEQVLRGGRGLFAASEEVSREGFRKYVIQLRLEENFPGIQGVGYAKILSPSALDKHVSEVRKATGHTEYHVWPEDKRDFYTSIIYLEPFSGRNLRAFGYDMYSESTRRSAMEKARDSGNASLSGKVLLVQETNKAPQAGFLIYLPVYKNGAPQGTLEERRTNIIGWVYSPLRMDDLALGMYGERASDLDIEIYDGENISPDTLMHDSHDDHTYEHGALSSTNRIQVTDHIWTLKIHSLPGLELGFDNKSPLITAYIGLVLSLLFASVTWLLIIGRGRAYAYAYEMNKELIHSEAELRDSKETLQAVLNSSEVAIAWANERGEIEYANPKFTKLFGYTLEELPTLELWYLHAYPDESYRAKVVGEWNDKVAHSQPQRLAVEPMEVSIKCKNGDTRRIILVGSWLGTRLLVNFNDITERAQHEQLVERMAHYDGLTELPNRALFSDRLHQAFAAARREKMRMALMFIDLDKFKPINDEFGHQVGDLVLKEAAKRMRDCVRESDTVARIGGDEFVVLLSTIEAEKDALVVAEKIRETINQPFIVDGKNLGISSSTGIAIFPDHGEDEVELMKNADTAMYQAKDGGRNSVVVYYPDIPSGKQ